MKSYPIHIEPFGKSAVLVAWPNQVEESILQDILEFANNFRALKLEGWELVIAYNSITMIQNDGILDFGEIKELIEKFKSKKEAIDKAVADEEKKNLEIKQGLIARLRNLIQHEENIGTLFNEIKEIQANWKEVGNIPRKVAQEINQDYHNLNEQFYYNINIYKELKEHDLKKNYSLKNQIVHKMKDLMNFYIDELDNGFREIIPLIQAPELSDAEVKTLDEYDQNFANREKEIFLEVFAAQDEFAAANNISLE